MASDLALATQAMDTPGAFIGASIDFKAAHKQIQVRPDEHGLLLFAFQSKLYHYRVCYFGGRFCAYWCALFRGQKTWLRWQSLRSNSTHQENRLMKSRCIEV